MTSRPPSPESPVGVFFSFLSLPPPPLCEKVDQWLETCWNEFEVPALALVAGTGNQSVIGEAKRHLLSFLATVNARLATR